jgi:hypothetical protein
MSPTKAFQRVTTSALQVELSTISATVSNLDPTVVWECWKTSLGYSCGGERQKLGPCGDQKPARGGSGYVEGPSTEGDPPHGITSA